MRYYEYKEGGTSMTQKYALFIIGERNSGKSTLIRSLTGYGRKRLWRVKSLGGRNLWAFIIHQSPQEMGMNKYPPKTFPDSLEQQFNVQRSDYDLLICALELIVRSPQFSYQQYINSAQSKGFNVRMAIISRNWNGNQANQAEIQNALNFAQGNSIPFCPVDASNDPNDEAHKIRQQLYPP